MKKLRYVGPYPTVLMTGPLTGPVEPDQVRDATDEDAESLLNSEYWEEVKVPQLRRTAIK